MRGFGGWVQINEVKVNGLIHSLHRLRARGRPLADSLPEVMEIVSCINDVRGNQLVGVNSFISTQFVSPPLALSPPSVLSCMPGPHYLMRDMQILPGRLFSGTVNVLRFDQQYLQTLPPDDSSQA